jgi:hypothetical protein
MRVKRALAVSVLALLQVAAVIAMPATAEEHNEVYAIDDVWTDEGQTTQREILLLGETVLEAWFNFTVRDDDLDSDPDSFTFTIHNIEDPSITLSLPGATDDQGNLFMPFAFTREASPRWRVSVTCNNAGDLTIFGIPVPGGEDLGNEWSLQVDYIYHVPDTNGNGGNGGNGGGDGDGQPMLVTALEGNVVVVALLSLLVAFLALLHLRGGEHLRLLFGLNAVIAVDAFLALPVALLVNVRENDALLTGPPLGPGWLGNLALVLFVIWLVPLLLAKRRLMTSRATGKVLTRVIGEGVAERVRARGERFKEDPLPEGRLVLLVMVVAAASVVLGAMMLML